MTRPLHPILVFDGPMRGLLERILLFPMRARVWWRNRHRLRAWEGALASIRKIYERSGELGLENLKEIYNVGLYVLLVEHDLASLSDDMVFATNDWRRKFVARQMAVLLYEGVEDLPALLAGRFRERLDAIGLDPAVVQELNGIMKQFSTFKRQHAPELEELRNFVGAHRDHDAGAQLRLLDGLKPIGLFELQGKVLCAVSTAGGVAHPARQDERPAGSRVSGVRDEGRAIEQQAEADEANASEAQRTTLGMELRRLS